MGYLFALVSVITGNIKGFCGKKTSSLMSRVDSAFLVNSIRMAFCIAIGAIVVAIGGEGFALPSGAMPIALLSGVSTSLFVVFWILAVRKSAYMMIDVFLMIGVIIPMVLGKIFFDEQIKPTQWAGFTLLIVATAIMCLYNISINGKMKLSDLILPILCGVANGATDFSQRMLASSIVGAKATFNFYTYAFSFIILALAFGLCSLISRTRGNDGKSDFSPRMVIYIFIMAVCLFFSSYTKTLAADHLSSVTLYPLCQGLSLVGSITMAALFFGEKPNGKCIFGVFLAFASLMVINLL